MPSSATAATAAIASFRRRVAVAAFLAGAAQALLVVAALFAVTLLVARLCGAHLPPSWWWLLLGLPVVSWGGLRARRERLSAGAAAAHLDRRLGLDGLLLSVDQLCVDEGVELDAEWRGRVHRGLSRLPAALPRTRWRRILPVPLIAAGLAVLTASLPPPPPPEQARELPTFEAEVDRLGSELRELFERGHVPEEVEEELRQKHGDLEDKVAAGEVPEWRDFDELDQRISREQLMQLAAEGAARASAAGGDRQGRSAARSPESLQAAAKMLADLGLLDDLPAQFAAALAAVRQGDGSFALEDLPFDAAQLQALAEAFGDAFGDLQGMDLGSLGLPEGQLAELQALVEGFCEGGGAGGEGSGPGGRGGVDRGPGHAALSLTESAEGAAGKAMPLPPGRGLPREWVPVGSERITPVVAPKRSTAAGSAGAAGSGGATWQLDYAPRHRAVLRRFFESDSKADK